MAQHPLLEDSFPSAPSGFSRSACLDGSVAYSAAVDACSDSLWCCSWTLGSGHGGAAAMSPGRWFAPTLRPARYTGAVAAMSRPVLLVRWRVGSRVAVGDGEKGAMRYPNRWHVRPERGGQGPTERPSDDRHSPRMTSLVDEQVVARSSPRRCVNRPGLRLRIE